MLLSLNGEEINYTLSQDCACDIQKAAGEADAFRETDAEIQVPV